MKRWIIWSMIAIASFSVGLFTASLYFQLASSAFCGEKIDRKAEAEAEAGPVTIPLANEADEDVRTEFSSLTDTELLEYPDFDNLIDLHNTNGVLRSSEVVAKSGQEWLVMSEKNGNYSLSSARANVRQLKSVSFPGDENDAKIMFGSIRNPIFALRDLKRIRPGRVTTVYLRPTAEEIERRNLPIQSMKTGYTRDLNLNEESYTLRVSSGTTNSGQEIGVLVLGHEGREQVVARNYFHRTYGTIIGELLWAGDIDQDGKLDLYFDDFNEIGGFRSGLYLSSEAKEGELVRLSARFVYAGC